LNGTGLSISSNPVNITTPGTISDYVWFASPGQSQYFVPIELLTGTVGSTVRLPYVPNSMVMDKEGTTLYFGSARELMIFSTLFKHASTSRTPTLRAWCLLFRPITRRCSSTTRCASLFYLYNTAAGSYHDIWRPRKRRCLDARLQDALHYRQRRAEQHARRLPGTPTRSMSTASTRVGARTRFRPARCRRVHSSGHAGGQCGPSPARIANSGTDHSRRGRLSARHADRGAHLVPDRYVGNRQRMTLFTQVSGGRRFRAVQSDVLTATTDGKHILSAALLGGGITLSDIALRFPAPRMPHFHRRHHADPVAADDPAARVNQVETGSPAR
jgi:hypothetical protein